MECMCKDYLNRASVGAEGNARSLSCFFLFCQRLTGTSSVGGGKQKDHFFFNVRESKNEILCKDRMLLLPS